MATSPIYNWPEPDNTDLVKNGALAIRTLGNAIDTTMATMVSKTVIDAKGDLIAGTAADTAARIAVGANDTVLTADSSTSTGLKWVAPSVPSYNWTTWSPSTTGITTGNGTMTSRYVQIGKTVIAQFKFVLGTTSAITGGVEVTLPVTAANTNYTATGMLIDGGASYYATNIVPLSTTRLWILASFASPYVFGLNLNSTTPYTWASTDSIQFSVTYEAA
jgi:hypothetical protein